MKSLRRVPVVYLAGGTRTKWQDAVRSALGDAEGYEPVIFIDPREVGSRAEADYTAWDLEGVRRADIVFAYLEHDNPSGAGLALEVGFAAGWNAAGAPGPKDILFVCAQGSPFYRYFGMARVCADAVFPTLEQGIEALRARLRDGAVASVT